MNLPRCRLSVINHICDKLSNCIVSSTCQLHKNKQRQGKGYGGEEKSDKERQAKTERNKLRRDLKEKNLRKKNRARDEDQKYYGEVKKENSKREEI